MAAVTIRDALHRVCTTFAQKPRLALQPDTPARAVWTGGLAMQVTHPDGHAIATDMPEVIGGTGAAASPGWLMRGGLAACTATVLAMRAEQLGIRLTRLEITVDSRSDARGMLGLDESVPAGPLDLDMEVEIAAEGQSEQALAELVAWADAHSPVGSALRRALDLRVRVKAPAAAAH